MYLVPLYSTVLAVLRTRSYFPTYFVEYEEISEAVESLDKKRKGQGQGQGSREDEEVNKTFD
ncbi:hypothetical protein K435DRAFT_386194 [Dendrothele bispora CBS 962.96]|uniref:Uncharacterized protein n=1 Tax=Dendrothele bispora (strain CBS 962.96) TaxID=1314807 RepID=A0A4S8LA98_DENBC|nr:hypothetical protein K435DRAFT_386194 [Dendrothele bispora CBS 962.96]